MKAQSLLILRISLGLLMLVWGLDKIINTEHGSKVAEHFYFGILSGPVAITVLGYLQVALCGLTILGLLRKLTYSAVLLITAVTALAVWKSIIDPWGWYLDGTNALFFPSLIVAAGAWVMMAFRDEDTLSLDHKRR